MKSAPVRPEAILAALLGHYDRHRRILPWRAPPGERPEPYRVWLSEIMLQQTTVAAVRPYFEAFLARWPTIADLAAAAQDDVMHAWQGLGYYSRARNLLKCAQAIVAHHGGRFPDTEAGLLALPGIGPYTAAAIAAIAFDRPAMPVDGNIERVSARLFRIEEPMPGAKPAIRAAAARLRSGERPGDVAQALMDLGATICTPKSPACDRCPLSPFCAARAAGIAAELPRRAPRPAKPVRHAVFFWLEDDNGRVLFERRPDSGLLGGMMMPPSTPWREGQPYSEAQVRAMLPAGHDWRPLAGTVRHVFTHFAFEMQIWRGRGSRALPGDVSVPPREFGRLALPTVAKKVCRHALEGGRLP